MEHKNLSGDFKKEKIGISVKKTLMEISKRCFMKNHLKGSFIAVGNLNNSGSTNVKEPLPELFGICDGAMQSWDRVFMYKDRLIRVNPHWIRDYVLTAKGFRYTEAATK